MTISLQRLGFAGTPAFAATILDALLRADAAPLVVYTQPDRRTGRGRRLQPSAVKSLAEQAGIPVLQPTRLGAAQIQQQLQSYRLDMLIVAAYGLILPQSILDIPRLGCINVHASILPRWRGAAPVERAMLAGDTQTGISIMQMDAGLDTGPILSSAVMTVAPRITGLELTAALAELGGRTLLQVLRDWPGLVPSPQQNELATYAAKLSADDRRLNFDASAIQLDRQIRALAGRLPVQFSIDNILVRIITAHPEPDNATSGNRPPGTILRADATGLWIACSEGILVVDSVQLNRGKGKPMSAAAAINGFQDLFRAGRSLG